MRGRNERAAAATAHVFRIEHAPRDFTGRPWDRRSATRTVPALLAVVARLAPVPFLGSLVETVVFLLGFGVLLLAFVDDYRNGRATEPTAGVDAEAV